MKAILVLSIAAILLFTPAIGNHGPEGSPLHKAYDGSTVLQSEPSDDECLEILILEVAKKYFTENVGRLVGPQGPPGPPGSRGQDGFQGIQGPQGERGFNGYNGERGPTGYRGEKGKRGHHGHNYC